ncbi:hypothetical protein TNCV_3958721 [Trichonephila clavipes]|nr:hypothetical protein TNCV_3958721 [Trichonephila clavipes]
MVAVNLGPHQIMKTDWLSDQLQLIVINRCPSVNDSSLSGYQ